MQKYLTELFMTYLADWEVNSWKLACASKTDLVILGLIFKHKNPCWAHKGEFNW